MPSKPETNIQTTVNTHTREILTILNQYNSVRSLCRSWIVGELVRQLLNVFVTVSIKYLCGMKYILKNLQMSE